MLRRAGRGTAKKRQEGAAAELRLHEELKGGEVILDDRRVPDGTSNIGHVVVAHSGVWIIDTKDQEGTIEYRNASGRFDADERLYVDGEDCSHLAYDIYAEVIPVAKLLADRSIPIHPAIVFVNAKWKLSLLRRIINRPYTHNRVTIAWPAALLSAIKKAGPLTSESIARIGEHLDKRLEPM